MIGIVIVAHGGLAREYLSAVEHVVGPQTGIAAVAIEDNHDRGAKMTEIRQAADAVDDVVRRDHGDSESFQEAQRNQDRMIRLLRDGSVAGRLVVCRVPGDDVGRDT